MGYKKTPAILDAPPICSPAFAGFSKGWGFRHVLALVATPQPTIEKMAN
jgi:hypothetical protein